MDEIPIEVFKTINNENVQYIIKLFHQIYHTGILPDDAEICVYPKNSKIKRCVENGKAKSFFKS